VTPDRVVRAALGGTALFVVLALGACAVDALVPVAVVVDLVLFVLGCAAFVATLLRVADRSRDEELTVAGIWFLTGSAPARERRLLLGALLVQSVVALATPAREAPLALGVFATVFGVGCIGLWAALGGTFPPRRDAGR
jgi:hypothetical protein